MKMPPTTHATMMAMVAELLLLEVLLAVFASAFGTTTLLVEA